MAQSSGEAETAMPLAGAGQAGAPGGGAAGAAQAAGSGRPADNLPGQRLALTLQWAQSQDYAGYSKFDAFNSPVMRLLAMGNPRLRMYMTAAWARSPINFRPLLGTTRSRNPKGIALFALAYLRRHAAGAGGADDLDEARKLLAWLEENHSRGYSGMCWGYDHPWQSVHFYAPRYSPNIVVTGNVAYAFLEAFERTGEQRYLDIARSSVDFLLKDLAAPIQTPQMRNIGYVPGSQWGVLNINGLASAILIRVWQHTREQLLADEARRLMAFLIDKQTDYGAWHYAWPAITSNVKHDNYHTGNKLDWILDYTTVSGDDSFRAAFEKGLRFYQRELFLPDGAPKWMSDRVYPFDIHSSAQGIVTLSKAAAQFDPSCLAQAELVANWALQNMQDPRGFFYYQRGRFWSKRYTLMRWCNGWMAYALASLLLTRKLVSGAASSGGAAAPAGGS